MIINHLIGIVTALYVSEQLYSSFLMFVLCFKSDRYGHERPDAYFYQKCRDFKLSAHEQTNKVVNTMVVTLYINPLC